MKKLFACTLLLVSLFAFGSVASATPLFEENFDYTSGLFGMKISDNWTGVEASTAGVNKEYADDFVVMSFYDNKSILSNAVFNVVEGQEYSFTVSAREWSSSGATSALSIGIFVPGAEPMTTSDYVVASFDYSNTATTELVYTFVADANMAASGVQLFLSANAGTQFDIFGATFNGQPSQTPIPAAAVLLMPGLAGLAVLRKRFK